MARTRPPDHPDPLIDLLGAVARQAITDAKAGYHGKKGMHPRQWLMLAGLMASDGTIPRLRPATYPPSNRVR